MISIAVICRFVVHLSFTQMILLLSKERNSENPHLGGVHRGEYDLHLRRAGAPEKAQMCHKSLTSCLRICTDDKIASLLLPI